MNQFIEMQCQNMVTTVEVFEQACALAARKDDGQISSEEEKVLKRIYAAAKAFKQELKRLKR